MLCSSCCEFVVVADELNSNEADGKKFHRPIRLNRLDARLRVFGADTKMNQSKAAAGKIVLAG